MHEEDALREEKQFMENLTKVELRESRALCSSMRFKLKYYGEEVARLRQAGHSLFVSVPRCAEQWACNRGINNSNSTV